MTAEPTAYRIVDQYALGAADIRVESVPAQGFSGARLWKVRTGGQTLCLRRWAAEHPRPERLAQIHEVLHEVQRRGGPPLPVPLLARHGPTFLSAEGHLWQLEPWLPGRPDYEQRPSTERLREAMVALAQFHCSAVDLLSGFGPSPALAQRLQATDRLARLAADYRTAIERSPASPLAPAARQVLDLALACRAALARRLEPAVRHPVPLQACIRDVWHDNVLFDGDRVSGLVDFGGLGQENVAADVARLLGSLVGDDPAGWEAGLAAYQRVRPLSELERPLVGILDQANTVLGGVLWIEWLFCQRRTFFSLERVHQRLTYFQRRLEVLAPRLGR